MFFDRITRGAATKPVTAMVRFNGTAISASRVWSSDVVV